MSPKTDSPTRTKLLDAAEELMLGRGYVATSVDAVCEAAAWAPPPRLADRPPQGLAGKTLARVGDTERSMDKHL